MNQRKKNFFKIIPTFTLHGNTLDSIQYILTGKDIAYGLAFLLSQLIIFT